MSKKGQRTLLGFDFGTKRIGIAIAQEVTGTARPLITVNAIKHKPDWDSISKIISEWQPDLLVVGLPLHMDGTEQEMTRTARRFANQLNGRYNIPIALMDERLSSDEAESILNEQTHSKSGSVFHASQFRDSMFPDKAQIDMISAQLILQSWMSQHI
ncbi:MAG: Holliday junction resolvase RuvX [Gammaproteobacteria bacterium]|nr:Holliday junction resolvase RuvX [Gammaproteobacteria bacterium]MCW8986925.1 Holliday junction resolvase RuvX [Gammaproteobacteria bacterium]MCW9031384.1 Holliday junction resolvase RuvX [Gammaproteobacteria bacterium]